MKKLLYAQDCIKTNNSSVACGFNMFVMGDDSPKASDFHDYIARSQGYEFAQNMAKKGEIAFTHKFRCKCGGYPFQYGGFWVCNDCGGKNVDEDWWKVKVEKDGNKYCCHGLEFLNLQESDNYSFGDTFEEAIKNYGDLMLKTPQNESN